MSLPNSSRRVEIPGESAIPQETMDQHVFKNKRPRDDIEAARTKLLDQKFNIKAYHDPLLPRQGSPSQYFPKGVTAEMEKSWLAKIEASRNQDASQ